MPTVQRFVYEWPEGANPILFLDWIKLLSESEQEEFHKAKDRQEEFRQQAVDQGRLQEITGNHYTWKNKQEAEIDKATDPVWEQFWKRYLHETQTQFKVIYEEVVEIVGQSPRG
jgi:hypothetical protein